MPSRFSRIDCGLPSFAVSKAVKKILHNGVALIVLTESMVLQSQNLAQGNE